MMEGKADRTLENGGEMEKVCSLCGDIGFENALILCRNCGFRLQHTYCSRFYPEIDLERWCCEWCLHEEEKEALSKRKKSKVFEFLLEIAQSFPENDDNDKRILPRTEDRSGMDKKSFVVGNREIGSKRERLRLKKNVRCLKNNNKALDRWRNLSKSKLGCRRYKLLADVRC